MGDILKVTDLPAKWRYEAKHGVFSRGTGAAPRESLRECADDLDAALSRQDGQVREGTNPWQLPWQLPFSTVSRVARALTQLGVAVPESSEEQFAKVVSLVEMLCDEAAPGKLRVQPDQQAVPKSPMARMAEALRDKAAGEREDFGRRVQSGEWGPMPDQDECRSFCAVCDGSGWKDAAERELCPVCGGRGI